ncbi:hypothetical protein [Streptomyces sp. NPDC088847]|uniref:hypothetical protein n=1 Tax=Streptomyces sp. NPDC088847 TaxID=3365909 RepID=UPI0037FBD91A
MGNKPSTAASTQAAMPTASGTDAISADATATDTVSSARETTSKNSRFGMPHALVIIACIVTAAVLAPHGMTIRDILTLLAGAGIIGAVVVVTVVTGGNGRITRFMRAYLTSGN